MSHPAYYKTIMNVFSKDSNKTPHKPLGDGPSMKGEPSKSSKFFFLLKSHTFPSPKQPPSNLGSAIRPNHPKRASTAPPLTRREKGETEEEYAALSSARREAARRRVERSRQLLRSDEEYFGDEKISGLETEEQTPPNPHAIRTEMLHRHDSATCLPVLPSVQKDADVDTNIDIDIDVLNFILTRLTKPPPHSLSLPFSSSKSQSPPTCQMCSRLFLPTDLDVWKVTGCRTHFLHGECVGKIDGEQFPAEECGRCEGVGQLIGKSRKNDKLRLLLKQEDSFRDEEVEV